ncbi:two-component system sensor histidine kinase NtrB [Camelimonas lactis]|uniref:histidine kinase n=1 Tax=Camelimonas lactis TaxID=659006 RepID=A0A4R2GWJ9_9HYPH|nr:ATP-binding protein [Camelimonas lactis]TCO13744.1 two-component system nitrogen regulation sensor histidine kinase GlnL [Camelimonas lactis]
MSKTSGADHIPDPGEAPGASAVPDAGDILNVMPAPIMTVGPGNRVLYVNVAAEDFFEQSRAVLQRRTLDQVFPFGSPVLAIVEEARQRKTSVNSYGVAIERPWTARVRVSDIFAAPMPENDENIIIVLQERTIAEKLDRQLTTRSAGRSMSVLGSMLAHEIKNPLSGIRGAAQLLEQSASEEDQELTRLICDEADRIVKLVERMEFFSDEHPAGREPVNIHGVLDHVRKLALSGFARHIRINCHYDPSLPPVHANRDQLIQVFLNLVKNAAEAIGPDAQDGEINLTTAFRAGIHIQTPGSRQKTSLPLEFCVTDNGPGVPPDMLPDLFDPFVTTKMQGSGLGLALVARIIGDHGGVVECESVAHRTVFRVLMPMYSAHDGRGTEA